MEAVKYKIPVTQRYSGSDWQNASANLKHLASPPELPAPDQTA